eukprot:TRINITY_DN13189_c0_g1_i1.p1 TRINITY_DN13189_c0_g1~~TRINITY_DN13189_c0_g1_i1.p1  ORF type:complete len:559 (+),score=45.18 TRINITY_DN13189_c0_g1_i1:80-1756(+)
MALCHVIEKQARRAQYGVPVELDMVLGLQEGGQEGCVPSSRAPPILDPPSDSHEQLSGIGDAKAVLAEQSSADRILLHSLRREKLFVQQLGRTAHVSFMTAVFSLIGMVVELIVLWDNDERQNMATCILKLITLAIVVTLLISIIHYYRVLLRLEISRNKIPPTATLLTSNLAMTLVTELLVCAIHSPPFLASIASDRVMRNVDGACGVLMLLRSYLVIRLLRYRNQFLNDAGRFVGALSHLRFSPVFVIKTNLESNPLRTIGILMGCVFMAHGFVLYIVEKNTTGSDGCEDFVDTMWLVAITMSTVGFGDVVPGTKWGRLTTISAAICGMFVTALLVATIHNKLQLRDQEFKLVEFLRIHGNRTRIRKWAARVIQSAYRLHRSRKGDRQQGRRTVSWATVRHTNNLYSTLATWRTAKRANTNTTMAFESKLLSAFETFIGLMQPLLARVDEVYESVVVKQGAPGAEAPAKLAEQSARAANTLLRKSSTQHSMGENRSLRASNTAALEFQVSECRRRIDEVERRISYKLDAIMSHLGPDTTLSRIQSIDLPGVASASQ